MNKQINKLKKSFKKYVGKIRASTLFLRKLDISYVRVTKSSISHGHQKKYFVFSLKYLMRPCPCLVMSSQTLLVDWGNSGHYIYTMYLISHKMGKAIKFSKESLSKMENL